jgi:mannose-6-phosphate isomerase
LDEVSTILKLVAHMVPKIWGGTRLGSLKGDLVDSLPIGETWEISAHPDGPSFWNSESLRNFVDDDELPFLVKFIDTSDNLSIQVHPDDEYAQKYENSKGKTECWVVLDSEEGAGIYLGLKEGVSRISLEKSLKNKEDISKLLNFYPVKKGDFFRVPSGTIHAIGKNVFLAEVQQSSGVTYRVWDWNRVDSSGVGRELHIDKALDVIRFESNLNNKAYFKGRNNLFQSKAGETALISHENFNLSIVSKREGEVQKISQKKKRASGLVCLEGALRIFRGKDQVDLKPFESILIPIKGEDIIIVEPLEDSHFLYVS